MGERVKKVITFGAITLAGAAISALFEQGNAVDNGYFVQAADFCLVDAREAGDKTYNLKFRNCILNSNVNIEDLDEHVEPGDSLAEIAEYVDDRRSNGTFDWNAVRNGAGIGAAAGGMYINLTMLKRRKEIDSSAARQIQR